MSGEVRITVSRDVALMMIGWVNANRPTGEWDPGFLLPFLEAMADACTEAIEP